jgi:signal peptidase II
MFVVLIPVLTCLDLVIKYAINSMDNKDLPRNIAGKIEIDKFHNKGFPFGKLKENQRVVKYIPVFITSVLIGGLSFLLPQKGKKIKKLSLSLIIAGSLSNIFDRFTRGYVVDYIRIKVKGLDKVIFNIGDIFIVLGSLMMPFGSKKKINNIVVDNIPTEE